MSCASQDEIHRIWDRLSDFDAGQWTAATAELMSALAHAVGAWNATWAGAIRVDANSATDPLHGWRVGAVQALHPVDPHADDEHFREILRIWDRRDIDPSFLLPLRNVGSFRTYSFRRDLRPEWFETPFFRRHYGAVGSQDAVFIAFPLNEDCESHFGFYSERPFGETEIACLAYALRGIKWFHRHLMLSCGLLMATSPLTPTEKRVLQLLLTRASEKEIARKVEIAPSTAHQHITRIFRKFGVRSRAGLMSIWLGRGG